jgi:hypothetical protein
MGPDEGAWPLVRKQDHETSRLMREEEDLHHSSLGQEEPPDGGRTTSHVNRKVYGEML